MAFESLARTLRKPFYLKHLLVAIDVLAYIFTPICSVPFLPLDRADMTQQVGVEREVRHGGNP